MGLDCQFYLLQRCNVGKNARLKNVGGELLGIIW